MSKVNTELGKDAFSTKVNKSKKLKKGEDGLGDGFTSPVKMVGIVTDADAFASKVKNTRLKGKKGQKGWMSDSFSTALTDSQFIVDADAFSSGVSRIKLLKLKRHANGAQGSIFKKTKKEGPKNKNQRGQDDFTISPKEKKKQLKRRNSTNETDLFQRGVMPK